MTSVADNVVQPSPRSSGALIVWALALYLAAATGHAANVYKVTYTGTFVPNLGHVRMEIDVTQERGQLRRLNLRAPKSAYANFAGSGKINRKGARLIWQVPKTGGTLSYTVAVDNQRSNGRFDARMTDRWALLRLDDLVPSARVRARRGAHAKANLYLTGPAGWAVETPYGHMRDGPVSFEIANRRFDRPLGWAMAGNLGIRREEIAGRQVAVAAPSGSKYPRLPTLAFLRWTLPHLVEVFPQFPERLLIVSAFDDMWRGALSGPSSLYLHGDRPLISENGTSTLLHELVHVATRMSSDNHDWIVEGLAEYYGIKILRDSGGLSQMRYDKALADLAAWAERESASLSHPSSGPHTARAVILFHNLDQELVAAGSSLDTVVTQLLERGTKVSRHGLNSVARSALGHTSKTLRTAPATQTLR